MIRHMKRAQAAMEFLMTYGWAILVVLIAIGALAYFGVLNPSRFLPASCTIAPGLSCGEFKVSAITTNNVEIYLQNGMGSKLTLDNIGLETVDGTTCTIASPPTDLNDGGSVLTTWTCGDLSGSIGDRFKADLTINYTKSGESLSHTVMGSIVTEVE